jgi:hypothetical protein
MPATAVPAAAAHMALRRGGNSIAAAKLAHLRAQLLNRPCNFVAEDNRQLHPTAKCAIAHHDVMETDAASRDGDSDLARPRLARRHNDDAQHRRRAGFLGNDRMHAFGLRQSAFSQSVMIFHLPP